MKSNHTTIDSYANKIKILLIENLTSLDLFNRVLDANSLLIFLLTLKFFTILQQRCLNYEQSESPHEIFIICTNESQEGEIFILRSAQTHPRLPKTQYKKKGNIKEDGDKGGEGKYRQHFDIHKPGKSHIFFLKILNQLPPSCSPHSHLPPKVACQHPPQSPPRRCSTPASTSCEFLRQKY